MRFPEKHFLDYMKQVLTPEAFEAVNHSSIFDKAVLCLGRKRGTVLPEIFARVLFSLNLAVGVGPRKLSVRNFCTRENFDLVEFIATCT